MVAREPRSSSHPLHGSLFHTGGTCQALAGAGSWDRRMLGQGGPASPRGRGGRAVIALTGLLLLGDLLRYDIRNEKEKNEVLLQQRGKSFPSSSN